MAYNKYTWKSGDVISSARLNNIEDGIEEAMSSGGGVMIVNVTPNEESDGTYVSGKLNSFNASVDKTYNEIKAAFDDGQMVVAKSSIGEDTIYFLPTTSFANPEELDNKPIAFEAMLTTNKTTLLLEISTDKSMVTEIPISPYLQTSKTNDESGNVKYSNTGWTFNEANLLIDKIKLRVVSKDETIKTMFYAVIEQYLGEGVIAFGCAGKAGSLYMDKNGNISETFPTSSSGGGYS